MDKFQKEFISLIQSAFTEKANVISSDFDWEKAVRVAKKHNIASIIFYGAANCNVPQESEHMSQLFQSTLQSMSNDLRQTYEIEQIEAVFDKENISYMPIKGTILKKIYPKTEMRTMGDADILIKLEQYPQIERIMTELGFAYQYESDHELVWSKPALFLELHKSIMTSYNKDFYQYFGTGWGIAKQIGDSSRYEMSTEDFYLYIFVHFTKHYRITGIGIKHLVDLWVYANAHPEMNWAYLDSALKKLRLQKFHTNVQNTIRVWFEEDTDTEITDLITNVIFHSGQYGSADRAVVNRALQNGKDSAFKLKLYWYFKGLFLPYSTMKKKYRILEKLPILLPFMWIVRFFDILFHRKSDVKQYMQNMNQIDTEQVKENKRALHAVGLDFQMEEHEH